MKKAGSGFGINKFLFNTDFAMQLQNVHYAKDLWPVVYVLSSPGAKEAYIGETADAFTRLSTHLKNKDKNKLPDAYLINSPQFNKSATLDIESNLIKYVAGDGQYKILNNNLGLANHNYYQKREVYWELFKSIWDHLRAEGFSKHSLDFINNSDLFKYSPYKSLSQDQKQGLILIIRNLLNDTTSTTIMQGGAGTGKTILAVFLFKLLNTDITEFNTKEFGEEEEEFLELLILLKNKYPEPKMALVIPMASFRNTIRKVFKNIKGLSATMVVSPAAITNGHFDIIVVDEAHRLRRRINLGTYYGGFDAAALKLGLDKDTTNELEWVLKQSTKSILFYDDQQSIKPSDVLKKDFDALKSAKTTKTDQLRSQFRAQGGTGYVNFISGLLNASLAPRQKFISNNYEFLLFDSIEDMMSEIQARNHDSGLARMLAGYSWPWISKKDPMLMDIKIGNTELKWNSVASDWINSAKAINEVGCIHTTQGYDLNYAGIIFGNEISYDESTDRIVILKENYHDKNGKQTITDLGELRQFILNIYKTLMLRGIKGTYVYACNPALRSYFKEHISEFGHASSTPFLPKELIRPYENAIPYYDLKAAAGSFTEPRTVERSDWVALPAGMKASEDLFACMVTGESMNRVIPNGSICIFRKYNGGSRNGKIVLVQYSAAQDTESGSAFTVKEYHSSKKEDGDSWMHGSIVLKPLSYDSTYEDILISAEDADELTTIALFECKIS